jgi:prepilin-type N-terminal cleavage/methylation domain-containing protein
MRRAFTLVEVLAVIAIIIILLTLAAGAYQWSKARAQVQLTETVLTLCLNSIDHYFDRNRTLPPPPNKDSQGRWSWGTFDADAQPRLIADRDAKGSLVDIPSTCISGTRIVDAWGGSLRYAWHYPGGITPNTTTHVSLTALGKDGTLGTSDDLRVIFSVSLPGK